MSSDAGTIALGDPYALLSPSTNPVCQQDDIFKTVNNNGFSWLTLENRLSAPIWVCPGSGFRPVGGISIPALSLACVPVDPDLDVVIGLARGDDFACNGTVNNTGGSFGVRSTIKRIMPYTLQHHGSFFITELYPIRDCMIVSRQTTLAALASITHGCGTNTDPLVTQLLDNGGTLLNSLYRNAHTPDSVIMRALIGITSLGAAALSDLTLTAEYSGNSHGSVVGFSYVQDIRVLGGGTVVPPVAAVVDLPGVNGIKYQNTHATASITLEATYYIGTPHDVPISAIT